MAHTWVRHLSKAEGEEKYGGKSRLGMVNRDFSKGGHRTNHPAKPNTLHKLIFFSQLWNSVQYFDLQHFSSTTSKKVHFENTVVLGTDDLLIFLKWILRCQCVLDTSRIKKDQMGGSMSLKGLHSFEFWWGPLYCLAVDAPVSLFTKELDRSFS